MLGCLLSQSGRCYLTVTCCKIELNKQSKQQQKWNFLAVLESERCTIEDIFVYHTVGKCCWEEHWKARYWFVAGCSFMSCIWLHSISPVNFLLNACKTLIWWCHLGQQGSASLMTLANSSYDALLVSICWFFPSAIWYLSFWFCLLHI